LHSDANQVFPVTHYASVADIPNRHIRAIGDSYAFSSRPPLPRFDFLFCKTAIKLQELLYFRLCPPVPFIMARTAIVIFYHAVYALSLPVDRKVLVAIANKSTVASFIFAILVRRFFRCILYFSHDASSKADWLDTRFGYSHSAYRYLYHSLI